MKKVLFLARKTDEIDGFAQKIENNQVQITTASYDDLRFWLDDKRSQITLAQPQKQEQESNITTSERSQADLIQTHRDIREYDKIISLTTPYWWQLYQMNALACYCRKYEIQLYDDAYAYFAGKLYQTCAFWEQDLPVPKTAFGSVDFFAEILQTKLNGTGILKANNLSRGRKIFLVHSETEIQQIMKQHTDTQFILQNFIPNNGDYRVILLDYVPRMVIYRSARDEEYRNNTSLGGKATIIPLEQTNPEILELATKATKIYRAKIAGADIVQDRETGRYYILEVNRTPQLASGTFVQEKATQIRKFLEEE